MNDYQQQLLGDQFLYGITPNRIILGIKANSLLVYHY